MSLSYDLANVLGIHSAKSVDYTSLGEVEFQRMVSLELRRATRSQKSSLLMLIDMSESATTSAQRRCLQRVLSAMQKTTRETDITGWYKENSVIGVMFTEITFGDHSSIPPAMMSRLNDVLKNQLSAQELRLINIDFHFLSEPAADVSSTPEAYAPVYSEIPVAAALAESAF